MSSVVFLRTAVEAPDAGDAEKPLPTEFRIFRAGANPSVKGTVVFDARAAELVMAAAAQWGNDYMIDLEHNSLIPRLVDSDNSDHDARGWFRPEVRDGELWAAGVTWTADGAARLRDRRQRYMSPAFYTRESDPDDVPRVTELINVALCAMPATDQLEALVASRGLTYVRTSVTVPDRMAAEPVSPPPAAEDPAPAPVPASAAPAEDDAEAPAPAEDPAAVALSRAERAELTAFRAERDAREAAERRSLITALVELQAETPATAWSNNAPVARLGSEPLASLRERVAALRTARGTTPVASPTPPVSNTYSALTEIQRAKADTIKDPAHRERFEARCRTNNERAAGRK